jgi:AraC-like DNA-binding protein/DNA gyrase inhibitor GyrI
VLATASGFRLSQLLVEVQSRLHLPIDLASMAETFGASPSYFHRLFRDSTGETPRRYIERLRVERAALLLTMTEQTVAHIARSVGIERHETFARSFKRRFGRSPNEFREYVQAKRAALQQTAVLPAHAECKVSEVRFELLPPTLLLAKRIVGEYATFSYAPFAGTDRLWNPLAHWAQRHGVPYKRIGWGLTYDVPVLTPPAAQRFDACIPIDRVVAGSRDVRTLRFAGGMYAVVDHIGPASTLAVAYSRLFRAAIISPDRYVWREGPSVAIYGKHTRLCFAVTKLHKSKKRHIRSKSRR